MPPPACFTRLSRLASVMSMSMLARPVTCTGLPSAPALCSSPLYVVPSRCYQKLPRREPTVHSLDHFQRLAAERRAEREAAAARPPAPPLVVRHAQYQNPYFQQYQAMAKEADAAAAAAASAAASPSEAGSSSSESSDSPLPPPSVFAVVELNGSQYKVVEDDLIMSGRLPVEVGRQLVLSNVLLLASPDWSAIGRPVLPDCSVHAVVEEQCRTDKVLVFHKKRRKNHRKLKGYRDDVTILRITKILHPSIEALEAAATPALTAAVADTAAYSPQQPVASDAALSQDEFTSGAADDTSAESSQAVQSDASH